MSFIRFSTAEGGTSGTAVSQANSGTSGYAFDADVTTWPVYSNAEVQSGSLSYLYTVSTTQQCAVSWLMPSLQRNIWTRSWVYFSGLGSNSYMHEMTVTTGSAVARSGFSSTGQLQVYPGAGSVSTGTGTYSDNTWYRLETEFNFQQNQVIVQIYNNSGTLLETLTSAVSTTSWNSITHAYFGALYYAASGTLTLYMDNLAVSDNGWIGANTSFTYWKQNTAEGGTSGTTVTSSSGVNNTGGASGDAIDLLASGTVTFDSTYAEAGSLSYNFAGNSYVDWDVPGTTSVLYMRAYVYFASLPNGTAKVLYVLGDASAHESYLAYLSSTGRWYVYDPGGSSTEGTTTPAAATWYLVDLQVTFGSTATASVAKIYSASGTLLETITSPTSGTITTPQFAYWGQVGSGNTNDIWLDNIAASDQGWIGPFVSDSDSGAGTDALSSITANISDSDSVTGTDTSSVTAHTSGADTGAGTDAATPTAHISDTDSGTGTDNVSSLIISDSDTGMGVDSGNDARFTDTFMQPGTGGNPTSNLTWTQTRMTEELTGTQGMNGIGINTCCLQWSADPYQDTAYYASPTIPNNSGQLVPELYTAAGTVSPNMKLRLGLAQYNGTAGGDYYNFYYNNLYPGTGYNLGSFLTFQKTVASELYTIYGTSITGWYIPQEIDGNYPEGSTQANTATTYYQDLITYLRSLNSTIPIMVSPFYSGLQLTAAQFASALSQIFGGTVKPDIIAIQSGAGDASIGAYNMTPVQIASYFSAIATAFSGTGVQIWCNADMYNGSGTPMATEALLTSMDAAQPYVSGFTGFSFTSQMSPVGLGTPVYYEGYAAAANIDVSPRDADTGSGDDESFIVIRDSDSGAFTDNSETITAYISDSDSGAFADTTALTADVSDTESGTGTDVIHTGPEVLDSDSGTGTDTSQLTANISGTDSGTGTDTAQLTADISDSDSGTGTDTWTVLSDVMTDADTSIGTDTGVVLGTQTVDSDSGAFTDTASITMAEISDADSGAFTEASSITASISDSDSGTGTDNVPLIPSHLADTDSGAFTDTASIKVIITDTDSGHFTDLGQNTSASLHDSDTGAFSDTTVVLNEHHSAMLAGSPVHPFISPLPQVSVTGSSAWDIAALALSASGTSAWVTIGHISFGTDSSWNTLASANSGVQIAQYNVLLRDEAAGHAGWVTIGHITVPKLITWNTLFKLSQAQAADWRTLFHLTKSALSNWATVGRMNSGVRATRYNDLARVSVTGSASWNTDFGIPVSATSTASWQTLARTSAIDGSKWNVAALARISATGSADWDVCSRATAEGSAAWDTTGRMSVTNSARWETCTRVTAARTSTWETTARTHATGGSGWNALGRVTKAGTSGWALRSRPSQAGTARWNTCSRVSSTRNSNWRTLMHVTKADSAGWNLASRPHASCSSAWNTRVRTTCHLGTSAQWAVHKLVQPAKACTWRTLLRVTKDGSAAWNFCPRISATGSSAWETRQRLHTTGNCAWNEVQRPSVTGTSLWNTLQQVLSQPLLPEITVTDGDSGEGTDSPGTPILVITTWNVAGYSGQEQIQLMGSDMLKQMV